MSKGHLVFYSTKEQTPEPGFWILIVRLNRYAAYLWTDGSSFCPSDRLWSYLPDGVSMAGLPLPGENRPLTADGLDRVSVKPLGLAHDKAKRPGASRNEVEHPQKPVESKQ